MGRQKRNAIAVMNTKGGVGKSTIVMALAEVLSAHHGKSVLVIDADAQASVSSMLMAIPRLHQLQSDGVTLVELLATAVLRQQPLDWPRYVVGEVSDIDDARSVFLLASDVELTLLEREVSREDAHQRLRTAIATILTQARDVFDVVLVDCPPGLSVLTESWLREADLHITPTRADYVSMCALEVFRRFKSLNPEMGFAENLGVVVNMLDTGSAEEAGYWRWIHQNPDNRCFEAVIPRANVLQSAARFVAPDRSFQAKYPGIAGAALVKLASEVAQRMQSDWSASDQVNSLSPPASATGAAALGHRASTGATKHSGAKVEDQAKQR